MSGGVQVRRIVLAEVDLAAPLFDAYRQFYGQPPGLAGAAAFLRARLAHGESAIYLAEVAGLAAGFLQLYPCFSSISLKRLWILNDLFVDPRWRRAGVATRLMEAAAELARSTGAEGLWLETSVANHPAQRLYEKLGWQHDRQFHRYLLAI